MPYFDISTSFQKFIFFYYLSSFHPVYLDPGLINKYESRFHPKYRLLIKYINCNINTTLSLHIIATIVNIAIVSFDESKFDTYTIIPAIFDIIINNDRVVGNIPKI